MYLKQQLILFSTYQEYKLGGEAIPADCYGKV